MSLDPDLVNLIWDEESDEFIRRVKAEDALARDTIGIDDSGTYLHVCAKNNEIEMAIHLINLGADLNCIGGIYKASPMAYAASNGHLEMVELLRERGGLFDIQDDPGRNPLMRAVRGGHVNVVQYLLEAGIDGHVVYRVDQGKLRNAFNRAQEDGQTEIVELLAAHGCRPPIEGVDQPVWEMPKEEWTQVDPVAEQIEHYMAERFGPVDKLGLRELLPVVFSMSVTINVIPPNDEHPFLVLFTNGMSDQAMEGDKDWQYAELVMHLPPDWHHPRDAEAGSPWWWPIECLRRLAYHPHLNHTWFGPPAALVATGDPPEALGPNTQQTSLLLVPRFSNLRMPLRLDDGRIVNFFTVVPLYTEEYKFGLDQGMKALFEKFIEKRVPMMVEIDRPGFV